MIRLELSHKCIWPELVRVGQEKIVCMSLTDFEAIARELEKALTGNQLFVRLLRKGLNPNDILDVVQDDVSEPSVPSVTRADREAYLAEAMDTARSVDLSREELVDYDGFLQQVAIHDIRRERKRRKLTQGKLAEMANIDPSQLSRLERDPKSASASVLRRLANALEIELVIPPSLE